VVTCSNTNLLALGYVPLRSSNACLASFFLWVSWSRNQGIAQPYLLHKGVREEFLRIPHRLLLESVAAINLPSLFPCWLLTKVYLHLLEPTQIHFDMAPSTYTKSSIPSFSHALNPSDLSSALIQDSNLFLRMDVVILHSFG
jgi:hypothetical protein